MGKSAIALASMTCLLVAAACQTCEADYTINLIFQGAGSGDVKLQNGATILLNSSGPPAPTSIVVSPGLSITAIGTSTKIGLTTVATDTVEFQDLEVASTFRMQSVLSTYERKSGGTTFSTNLGPDAFVADDDFTLTYTFDFASNPAARQYQYYFGITPDPDVMALNQGSFFTDSPTDKVPWSAFSSLGTGVNLYGVLRVIDFGDRYADSAFEFDVSPAGGAAVPEPSSIFLMGVAGMGLWVRRCWRRKGLMVVR